MNMLFWLGISILAFYGLVAVEMIIGHRGLHSLREFTPEGGPFPRVSIVTAARNEARNIREAVGSLLALDYPDLEVIVVNDRSEDETGAILDEIASSDTRLQIVHLRSLPAGWLGKNHALWLGSRRATGELLLFTDADVVMAPTLLRRAVACLRQNRLDHLAGTPGLTLPGLLLPVFGLAFVIFFGLYARPWRVGNPKSSAHIGIGAFNLVRAKAYRAVGGHQPIRLRPDDDMKLGKILKKGGFRQGVAYAGDLMTVEWYSSLGEVVRGLEKNVFAGCDYRVSLVVAGVLLQLVCFVWPYLALFMTAGETRLVYGLAVLLLTLLLVDCALIHRMKWCHAFAFPFATLFFVWIIVRAVTLNLVQGGINWRGTFYSLEELKANRV